MVGGPPLSFGFLFPTACKVAIRGVYAQVAEQVGAGDAIPIPKAQYTDRVFVALCHRVSHIAAESDSAVRCFEVDRDRQGQ